MTNGPHIAIRADGGPDIGYGHLIRSGALAEELLRRDFRITYATTTPGSVGDVCPDEVEIVVLNSRSDVSSFVEWLPADVDATLIDSYLADGEYQRSVRERVSLAVVTDDTRHPICADVAINGNVYGPALDYEVLGSGPTWCLGPDYLLLRTSIMELTKREPPWREKPEKALVTLGGSDIEQLSPTVLRAFDGFDVHVDAIVGPGYSTGQERQIREAARNTSADIEVVPQPDDLPERMFDSDFAVTTASSTVYELLALGTPIACVSIRKNQKLIASSLRENDLAAILDFDDGLASLRNAVRMYMQNGSIRRERRERGRRLVDGRGTERIAGVMGGVVDG